MASSLLEMKGITRRFPGVVALDSVDLHVNAGEIVALVGENGAGKSTLMKILGGVHQPDAGTIFIDGNPVVIGSVSDAMSLGIGFMHQELNVLDNIDIAGNIFLGREPVMRRSTSADRPKEDLCRHRALPDAPGTRSIPTHPGKPALDRTATDGRDCESTVAECRILIMDEPTSSLTLSETERLMKVTRGAARSGREHHLHLASAERGRCIWQIASSCCATERMPGLCHARR